LSSQLGAEQIQRICAAAGAVFLAIAAVLTGRMLSPERTRAWTRTRSASEALKAELYKFWAKAAPYDGAANDAVECLRERGGKIEKNVESLRRYTASSALPAREPPGPLTPDDYIARRVNQQIRDYYRPKALKNAKLAKWFRVAELTLAIVAAVLAAIATVWPDEGLGAWVAVLTTIGGVLTAHMAASRFDFLVTSYLNTAWRLEDLRSQWPPAKGGGQVPSPEWSDFVRRCETAISAENESWMTKWTEEEKKAADSA
jgi:hypothetical protein